jgi:hypothetical protein
LYNLSLCPYHFTTPRTPDLLAQFHSSFCCIFLCSVMANKAFQPPSSAQSGNPDGQYR